LAARNTTRKIVVLEPFNKTQAVNSQAARDFWSLHQGPSRKSLVSVVADHGSPLYCIDWPDIGLSAPANLSRCKDAARQWAEQQAMTERGKPMPLDA
jgi:hypothetical protein